jgi:hypothetical protein
MKGITLSNFVTLRKPEYAFLKMTPNNSIRNQATHKIAKSVSSMHKTILQTVRQEDAKIIKFLGKERLIGTRYSMERRSKVSYYVYIEKKKVEFYFIIPKPYMSLIREKIGEAWTNITIKEVEELPSFSNNASKYQLAYQKEDGLSLASDRTNNDLLNSKLHVVDMMEEGDKVGIFYNFMPCTQIGWSANYRNTIDKVKKNMPTDRKKYGGAFLFKWTVGFISGIFDDVADFLNGETKKEKGTTFEDLIERMNGGRQISNSTKKKATSTILDTQIVVMSESENKLRQRNTLRGLSQSFDSITDDNRLIAKPLTAKINFTDFNIGGADKNKIGDEEAQNFISIAGRDILEKYNFIEKVDTQEVEVPEELRTGYMRIGTSTYRGHKQDAYLSSDKEFKYLSLILIAPNRAGKTTLIGNLAYDTVSNKECTILFDFCGNCELSNEVSALFPPDQVLNIQCEDPTTLQGLGYNEVLPSDDPFSQYDNAKKQTTQLQTLINSINTADTPLSPKMERYLQSASLVVFISNGSIRDVFQVLQNHTVRHDFISKVPKNQSDNMQEYIDYLFELDEVDGKSGKIVGTKLHSIIGVIDRLNKLKSNTYMEMMLKRDTSNNVNLLDEMQKAQVICIRMPEHMFTTDDEKDVYTTYWMTKIWMSLQMRKKKFEGNRDAMTKVNLVIDELYQVENTEKVLTNILSRLPKFNIKPILSCHYLNQIKYLRPELRSASASYMLIAGCDKDNYKELAEELKPFQLEDLMNLQRHESLNLIKTSNGYGRFITALPAPVNTIKKNPS